MHKEYSSLGEGFPCYPDFPERGFMISYVMAEKEDRNASSAKVTSDIPVVCSSKKSKIEWKRQGTVCDSLGREDIK